MFESIAKGASPFPSSAVIPVCDADHALPSSAEHVRETELQERAVIYKRIINQINLNRCK